MRGKIVEVEGDLSALEKEIFAMNEELNATESEIEVDKSTRSKKKSGGAMASAKKAVRESEDGGYRPGHLFASDGPRTPLQPVAHANAVMSDSDKITVQEKQSLIDRLADVKWMFTPNRRVIDESSESEECDSPSEAKETPEQRREALYQKSLAARARKEAKIREIQEKQRVIESQERERVRKEMKTRKVRMPAKCSVAGLDDHVERMKRFQETKGGELPARRRHFGHYTYSKRKHQCQFKADDLVLEEIDDMLL